MQHFVAALDGRIRSLASTHEILSDGGWLGIPLVELVQRELAPYATGSNAEVGGPEVMLGAEAGQVMGMVLHELVTNAAKYGALSTPSGRVSISWRLPLNGSASDRLVFQWRETGGPMVGSPSKSSYGMNVVRELIPYELGPERSTMCFLPEESNVKSTLLSTGLVAAASTTINTHCSPPMILARRGEIEAHPRSRSARRLRQRGAANARV